jgi:hypothetical protein
VDLLHRGLVLLATALTTLADESRQRRVRPRSGTGSLSGSSDPSYAHTLRTRQKTA